MVFPCGEWPGLRIDLGCPGYRYTLEKLEIVSENKPVVNLIRPDFNGAVNAFVEFEPSGNGPDILLKILVAYLTSHCHLLVAPVCSLSGLCLVPHSCSVPIVFPAVIMKEACKPRRNSRSRFFMGNYVGKVDLP